MAYDYRIGKTFTATGTATLLPKSVVIGTGTAFLSELAAGYSVTINGETRTVAAVISNTAFTVTVAFTSAASGQSIAVSFTATGTAAIDGTVNVVGTGTLFTSELAPGYSITINGETRVVDAISDNTHLTVTVAFTTTASGQTIDVDFTAAGTGEIAATKAVLGSGTIFTTEILAGYFITINNETRVVESVPANNLLLVTTGFSAAASGAAITGVNFSTLESLGLVAPKSLHKPFQISRKIGSGAARGFGAPSTIWRYGFLTRAQRDIFRTFCPEKSAPVFIRTRTVDGADAYETYSAIMFWPDEEERDAGRRPDIAFEFRDLVVYAVT